MGLGFYCAFEYPVIVRVFFDPFYLLLRNNKFGQILKRVTYGMNNPFGIPEFFSDNTPSISFRISSEIANCICPLIILFKTSRGFPPKAIAEINALVSSTTLCTIMPFAVSGMY
jgi:hypothetical protein